MRLFFLIALLLAVVHADAQKVLKLYKGGTKQALEYRVGEDITFKLYNDDYFYTFPIKDLVAGNILFENGLIKLEQIEVVRTHSGLGNILSGMLYTFGASWVLFSGVDVLYGDGDLGEVAKTAGIVTGTSFLSGFLFKKLLTKKDYKLKGRKFLRIVELNPN